MTDEAKKDLLAVMDQLEECREQHGLRRVSMFITADGWGCAWEYTNKPGSDNNVTKEYEPHRRKTGEKNEQESI